MCLFRSCFMTIASPDTLTPLTHTLLPHISRHQSRQHLHISQWINSVEHNPCRELSNALSGPPSCSPCILPPTLQYVQLQLASHSSLTDSCHSLFPQHTQLVSSLQPLAYRAMTLEPHNRSTAHVFCICAGSHLIEYSPFRSMYKLAEQSGI